MSAVSQTVGIVLSSRDWREADRLYTVFTRDQGKLELIGRGARKPLAKLAPHLVMCGETHLMVVHGKTFDTVAGAERLRAFPGIYQTFTKTLLAHQGLHLVDLGTKPHQTDSTLYDEMLAWLSFLDTIPEPTPERAGFLLSAFALKLLALLGYRPELGACLGCEELIRPGTFRWHALKGGVVCGDCCTRNGSQWFSARPMSDEALKLVRLAMTESFETLLLPRLPGDLLPAFHDAVESLIISHFPVIPAASLRAACRV